MGSLIRRTGILFLAVLMLCTPPALASSFQADLDGIDQAAKSVLMLEVYDDHDKLIATGSGFVAFDNFTLVTNHHVIEDADWIMAISDSGKKYMVPNVIDADESKDIALLEFFSPTDLVPLTLYGGGPLRRAEPVVAIGSPQGVTNTVSLGNISALYEEEGVSIIQFTAPISHGSSGGALFNNRGEVIGITSATFIDGQNMNLAVDIAEVIELHQKSAGKTRIAMGDFVKGAVSDPWPTNTPAPKLAAVTEVRAAAIQGGILLTWDAVEDAEQYRVYRSVSPNAGFSLMGTVRECTYSDLAVENGKTYYYKVSCISGLTISKMSPAVEVLASAQAGVKTPEPDVTPAPGSKLPPPQNVKAVWTDNGVYLSWNGVLDATGYFVYRSDSQGGAFQPLGSVSGTFFTDTKVSYDHPYFYKVVSVQGLKLSDMPEASAGINPKYTLSKDMAVPRNLKVKTNAQSATVTWSAVKDIKRYVVFRATDAKGEYIEIATVSDAKYTDQGVSSGKTYYYKVRSLSGSLMSDLSKYVTAKVPKPTPTPRPTKTPKPTPTPFREPKYPLEFGTDGYIEKYQGYPRLNPGIKNVSGQKTVDGFTLTYYCTNIYGDKIKRYGFGDYLTEYTYTKTIKPGKSTYPGYVLLEGYDSVQQVYVAITKIHTADGRTITIPETEWVYYYWTME